MYIYIFIHIALASKLINCFNVQNVSADDKTNRIGASYRLLVFLRKPDLFTITCGCVHITFVSNTFGVLLRLAGAATHCIRKAQIMALSCPQIFLRSGHCRVRTRKSISVPHSLTKRQAGGGV